METDVETDIANPDDGEDTDGDDLVLSIYFPEKPGLECRKSPLMRPICSNFFRGGMPPDPPSRVSSFHIITKKTTHPPQKKLGIVVWT